MTNRILLGHGGGGRMMHRLITEIAGQYLDNPLLSPLADAAELPVSAGRLAFSTDGFVVSPPDFPGGDIGKLAVCGTVNDVAMQGGDPWFLSLALILEEGLPRADLDRYLASIRDACRASRVQVVTGDTKVVPRGSADRIFIVTSGLGPIPAAIRLGPDRLRPGDRILVSGPVGDHEAAVIAARGEFELAVPVESDCAPLAELAGRLRDGIPGLRLMRDPTRGGLASALAELAETAGLSFHLTESDIPVRPAVRGLAEILGFDPLHMACEGRLLAIVDAGDVETALAAMRALPVAAEAAVIGEVRTGRAGLFLHTSAGGVRPLVRLEGSQLPRIC